MKEENINTFFNSFRENKKDFFKRKTNLEKLFGDRLDEFLEILLMENISIKKTFDELIRLEIIPKDTKYRAFYYSVIRERERRNEVHQNTIENAKKISTENVENHSNSHAEIVTQNYNITPISDEEKNEIMNKYFFGFNMDFEPDEVTNPIPMNDELVWEKANTVFIGNTSLDNYKIGVVLVATIRAIGENVWTTTWREVMMKESEKLEDYYARLQIFIDNNNDKAKAIFDATSACQRFAYHGKAHHIKAVRMSK